MTFRMWIPVVILFLANTGATPSGLRYELKNIFHNDYRTTPKIIFDVKFSSKFQDARRGNLAREYLRDTASVFRVQSSDMVLLKEQSSLLGKHYRFRQMLSGYEVLNGEIVVSVDNEKNKVLRVFNSSFPVSQKDRELAALSKKTLSKNQVYDLAWKDLHVRGRLLEKPSIRKAFLATKEGFVLVYEVRLAVEKPFGYWKYLVDAVTGKVLERTDRRLTRKPVTFFKEKTKRGSMWPRLREFKRFEKQLAKPNDMAGQLAAGSGLVFDPDPRTTLMNYALQDDSPADMFEAAYRDRELKDITFDGTSYHLKGPWVQIADFESPKTAPSTSTDGRWPQKRGNNAFNDVMTYYHIDKNQRYMQSLGFVGDKGIQKVSIEVDSDGVNGSDNSHYVPSANRMAFGHGCVDDNEDADVILHEYGHAINFSINSSWSGGDTGAMGEGFGDYWAGSYSITTENGKEYRANEVFTWDGNGDGNPCWAGRRMNRLDVRYDHSKTYGAHSPIENGAQSDELWSTPIFQALLSLLEQGYSRENVDRIILEAQFGLGSGMKMRDMANSIVQTARRLHPNEPYAEVFISKFLHHGIIEVPSARFELAGFDLANAGSNGSVDPGETVALQATVKNIGNHDADTIVGTLSSSSDGVETTGSELSFGSAGQGASAQNSDAFRVKLADNFQCGKKADFVLKLGFNGGAINEQEVSFSMDTGVARKTGAASDLGDGLEIPDSNKEGVANSITLDSAEVVKSLKVSVDIEHTYIGDLLIQLKAPSGKTIVLHGRSGGGKDNIQGTYPTTLNPKESLDGLVGESIAGDWSLMVIDAVASDKGKIKSWSIEAVSGYDCE